MLGFEAQEERNLGPDGRGGKLSETQCMLTTERTPEDNPGVVVRLENLKEKYGPSLSTRQEVRKFVHVRSRGV